MFRSFTRRSAGRLASYCVAACILTWLATGQPAAAQKLGPNKTAAPKVDTAAEKTADDEVEVVDLELAESQAIEAAAKTDQAGKTTAKLKTATQKVIKDPALQYTDPRTYRVKVGFRVEASGGKLNNVTAIGPIPMDWPEQEVRLLSEKVTPGARISQNVFPGQRAMMKLQTASIAEGESAQVERLYEVTRYRMQFVLPPDELSLPKQTPPEIRDQISGSTPGLETKHPKIVSLAESLRKENAEDGAWNEVHSFWKWTRDNVKFERGDFRGALFAVENHTGDCEELSALFVSMCRITNIGARTVWVDGTAAGHNYPEFYLVDKKGTGHWIPAQVVGPAWFGEMAEYRPIFQKGDRFYDPFHKEYVRYSPHTLRVGNGVPGKLTVIFEILADSDINGPSYNSTK
jgi:transglutaminase-like putative cysteine protease